MVANSAERANPISWQRGCDGELGVLFGSGVPKPVPPTPQPNPLPPQPTPEPQPRPTQAPIR